MRFSFFCLRAFKIIVRNRIRGERWCLAIWFDCSVLSWDCGLVNCSTNILCGCWLFWQNKIQVFCLRAFVIIVRNRIRGERWCLAIWFDCSALNCNCGVVNCGTNILRGWWLFWQNEIQVFCLRAFIIIVRNRIRGERWYLAIWCDCSALNCNCGLVNCGTNILRGCWLFWQLLTVLTKWDPGFLLEDSHNHCEK
jgi:hypothetical protein